MTIDQEDIERGFLNESLDGKHFYRFAKYFITMHHHKRFIMIDTETMRRITNTRIFKDRPNFNPKKSDVWSSFYLEDVEKQHDRFDFKIMSDGITANIFMMKLKTHELHIDLDTSSKNEYGHSIRLIDPPARERFDRITPELIERINEFDVKIGIDPGANSMASWTKQYPDLSEDNFSILSKTYREMAGYRKYEYNRRSVTRHFDRREREAQEANEIPIISKGPHYAQYVQHKLRFFNDGRLVYHHPYIRELKFDAHQQKLEAMYALAKRIIGYSVNGKLNEALIFFGHWRWKANSPIRGYRTPLKQLRFCLQQLESTVVVVNEHRTSMLCNFCAKKAIEEGGNSPVQRTLAPAAISRYNASRAILSKGLDLVAGRPLPRNYLKTTQNVAIRRRFPRH